MRKLYAFVFAAILSLAAPAQTVHIGTGTSSTLTTGTGATSLQSPINSYYAYTYAQTLYLQSEINAAGSITSIKYYFSGSSLTNTQDVKVYMGVVSRSAFTSNTDWEPLANLTLVFDGTLGTPTIPGWVTIDLTTPFPYNNTGNLLIAVDENTAGDNGTSGFRATDLGANRVLFYRNDVTNPNPATPPTANGRSNFVGNIQIDGLTLQGCQPATGLSTSNVTATTADAVWVAPAGGSAVTQYNWELRTSGAAGSGATGLAASGNSPTASLNLTTLTPATNYTLYVRSDCGSGSTSGWVSSAFTTLCSVTATPISAPETFATYLPNICWSEADGQLSASTIFTSTTASDWVQDDFGNVTSPVNKSAKLNIYGTGRYEWLISPSYDLGTAGDKQLEFDLAYTVFGSTSAATLGSDDKFVVLISTDDGATWSDANALRTWDSNTPISRTGEHIIIDLSAYTGVVKFAFYGESTVSNVDNDLFVDNFAINVIPACSPPSSVVVNNITANSADIDWTLPATPPAGFDVYYDITNTAPTASSTPHAVNVANPYSLSGLSANTTYYVWVRSNCGAGSVSTWTILPAIFVTECDPVNSLNENFNAATTPNLPSCWKSIIRGATVSSFATVNTSTSSTHTAPNAVDLYNSSSAASDDIMLISPPLSNLSAASHQLKFWGRTSSAANDVEVGTVDNSGGNAVFTVLTTVDLTTSFQQFTVDFSAYSGTDKHIAFRRLNASTYTNVYIDDVVWEPIPTCFEPTGVNVSNITIDGGEVNWTPPAIAPQGYDVYYSSDNTPPTGSTVPNAINVNSPHMLTGLNSSTTYYVWVRGNCGGTDVSVWSPVSSFATLCTPFATPTAAAETFATFLPNTCWSEADGQLSASTIFTSTTASDWVQDDFGNVTSPVNKSAKLNIYGTGRYEWLISPSYDLGTAGDKQLEFDLAYTVFASTASATLGSDDKFVVLISTDDGATWSDANALRTWDSNTPISRTGEHIIIDLSAYTGVVKFAFYGESTVSNVDNDLFVDNFAINVIPACSPPSSVVVNNITANSADIDWTPPTVAPAGYDVYYDITNTAPTASSTPNAVNVTNPYSMTGLNGSTTYYVWVRSNCGAGSVSTWTSVRSFTTACTAVNLPYMQNFNAATVPALPNCVSVEDVNNDAITWVTAVAATGYTGNMLNIQWNTSDDMDDWFYTAGLNLEAGKSYLLSYRYSNNSTSFEEKMKVAIGSSASYSAMTTVLADYPLIDDNTPRTHALLFTVPASGVYYIGFHGYSDADMFRLYLDDISVTEANVATTSVNSCVTVTAPRIDDQNNNKWMALFDGNGNVIGEINGNGNNLGNVTARVYRHSGPVRQDDMGRFYLDRNIEITPTTQPSTPVSLKLYFTAAELAALQGQAGSNVTSYTDITVFKNGDPCNSKVLGVSQKLPTVTSLHETNYVASFDVSSFSSFYFASSTYATLPANLISFSGQRLGSVNQLKWTVAQEMDVASYVVERSENGRTWSKAGTVVSLGNTSSQRSYGFTDNNISGAKQMYRLRQVDRNGSERLSNIVVITGIKPTTLTLSGLFPNPTVSLLNVLIDAPARENVTITVTDAVGRVVKAQRAAVEAGSNTLQMNVAGLSQGSYMIRVSAEQGAAIAVGKFVKE